MPLVNFNKPSVDPSQLRRNDEIRQRERLARTASVLDPPPAGSDQVQLGRALDGLQFQDIVSERIESNMSSATRLEDALSRTGSLQQPQISQTHRVDPAAKTEIPALDPAMTADRILGFVENQLIPAFQEENPDPSVADIETFRDQLLQGFEVGMDDARKILNGLGAMDENRQEQMSELENIVTNKLPAALEETLLA